MFKHIEVHFQLHKSAPLAFVVGFIIADDAQGNPRRYYNIYLGPFVLTIVRHYI